MRPFFVQESMPRPIPINRTAAAVGESVSAKRDNPAIGMQNVEVALLEALEIEVPGVLKGHAGKAERMCAHSLQE